MQIKRFEAKNMTKALSLIKKELGPEAVILSARSLRQGKGLFGSMKYAGVEVTAAIDARDTQLKTGPPEDANPAYAAPSARRRQSPGPGLAPSKRLPTGYSNAYNGRRSKAEYLPSGKSDSNQQRIFSIFYQQMLNQGVDRQIASQLIDEIKHIPSAGALMSSDEIKDQLVSVLKEMGVRAQSSDQSPGLGNLLALIGPSGAGKTTTIAKLAAAQTRRYQKQVALVSIDNYGIAANEQLKTFARIMGIPLETAVNQSGLLRSIKKFKHKDLILIDTPGINPLDRDQIRGLYSYFDQLPELQKHLVVSASTKEDDLREFCRALKQAGVQRLLFTKIDESRSHGNMLNALMRTSLPLSFLGCGRKVPDDIAGGTIPKLVELIFQIEELAPGASNEKSAPGIGRHPWQVESAPEKSYFLANKNSDVYHHTDCKWSHRIKPDNMIRFASSQEAESQNFLPCRSCNPDRLESDDTREMKTVTQKFSSNR